jgi:hypothetical protein
VAKKLFILAVLAAAFVLPAAAHASFIVARDATGIQLGVDAKGVAMVTFTEGGALKHVMARGAVDALAPSAGAKQVAFDIDWAGGWGWDHQQLWKTFANNCMRYDGPPLAYLVTACKAKDGSYWALQRWQRMLAEPRLHAVDEGAGRAGAAPLALDGHEPREDRRLPGMGLRRPLQCAVVADLALGAGSRPLCTGGLYRSRPESDARGRHRTGARRKEDVAAVTRFEQLSTAQRRLHRELRARKQAIVTQMSRASRGAARPRARGAAPEARAFTPREVCWRRIRGMARRL